MSDKVFRISLWENMVRVYVRQTSRRSASEQRAAHMARGRMDRDIYDSLQDAVKGLRRGEPFEVAHASVLGRNRGQIAEAFGAILRRKAVIVETETGRRSDDPMQLAEMIFGALSMSMGDERRDTMQELGRKSGAARTKRSRAGRLDEEIAGLIWANDNLTVKEREKQMTGWSRREIYKVFGKTGKQAGRPRKKTR